MAYEVDRLEIVIETATKRANKELDKLISKLNKVSTSLRSVAAAANQINKANQAISKTNERLSKTSQLSRKAAVELNNSSSSIVNASVVERLEMQRKEVALRRLIELQKVMSGTSQKLLGWSPQLPALNSPEMEAKRLNEEHARFHQEEQARAERTRSAWEEFINSIRQAIERMKLMSQSYEELNAKIGNYDGSLKEAMNAVVKLRQETEAYKQIMAGVTDVTNLSAQEQEKISEAYKKVANAANEARAAQEILKASEIVNDKGFGMSNLVGKDIQKEVSQFNAEYTKVRYNGKQVNDEMQKHSAHMGSANRSLLKLRRTLLNIISLVYVIRRAWSYINKALDLGETINLFQTVFRKIGQDAASEFEFAFLDRAEQFRDNIVEALHLDPNDIMNYMANFAQMANSMGVVSESAYRMSESLTVLGADVASLFNIDIDTAMGRLRAGLSGQIRPLRMMGVDISKTTLQMVALKYGITESIETMDAAAKVQLRYLAMTEQLTIAMGDMARTIDTPANQLRVLKQQWENFTRTLGTVFVPIVSKVLPILNGLLMALTSLSEELAAMMGYVEPDFTDETIYALGDLEDQAEETEETLQKLRATLGGFDELNILSSNQNEDIMGSGFAVLDKAIVASNQAYMEALNEQIELMTDKAGIWRDRFLQILPVLLRVSSVILGITVAIKALNLAIATPALLTKFSTAIGGMSTAFKGLGAVMAANPIAAAILIIVAAVTALYMTNEDFRNSINNLFKELQPAFESIMSSFSKLFEALEPIFEVLIGEFQSLGDVVAKVVEFATPIIVYFADMIALSFAGIVNILSGMMDFLTSIFAGDWTGAWEAIVGVFVSMWDGMKDNINAFIEFIKPVVDFITDLFVGIWDGLVDGLEAAWDFIKGIFKGIGDWFGDLGEGVGDVFKELLNKLISGLNWVISAPFDAINGILNGIKGINIFGAKPFDWIGTVPVPQIPMLATGGIVDYGQMFIAREAGAELVGGFGSKTGVMNNEQIVDAVSAGVANAVAQVMSQVDFGGRGGEQNVNVFLDGRQISSAIEQTRRQQGVSIVRGGNK